MSNTHLQDQISQFDLHDLLVTNEEFETITLTPEKI